ncbi:undecaprenyl-diphosphatase [Bacillus sp. FJAT-27231]|uniref:undecaprenyl-diphosphatase n=1 Tax=Bacillus sp. FJAT-27231 TaxID=1679168 RepID=UPI0009E2B072|nr:undecaprenyl-diphosphatase [Bacillus sp. FJAT-27231]
MNYEIFQRINGWAGHFGLIDTVMVALSNSVPYIVLALMLYLWFGGDQKKRMDQRYTALYTVFTSALALCVNAVIHLIYYHPRPFVSHHVHQLVPHAADSSFVSDHAVLVFAIAWTVLFRNDRLKYPIFIWAILVGLSRIYVGVHFPADVLGSILLACMTSILVMYFSKRLEPLVQFLIRTYNQFSNFFIRHEKDNGDKEKAEEDNKISWR